MPLVLVDTNILLRAAQPTHPMHAAAVDALASLRRQGDQPCLVPQNLVEFRAVCTRPVVSNGLGMTQIQARAEIARLKSLFPVLPDMPAILDEWERLVDACGALGKQNHDARLAAAMVVHRISKILTFNEADFTRYPGITVVVPRAEPAR